MKKGVKKKFLPETGGEKNDHVGDGVFYKKQKKV